MKPVRNNVILIYQMRFQGLLFHDTELMEQKDLNKDVPKRCNCKEQGATDNDRVG